MALALAILSFFPIDSYFPTRHPIPVRFFLTRHGVAPSAVLHPVYVDLARVELRPSAMPFAIAIAIGMVHAIP